MKRLMFSLAVFGAALIGAGLLNPAGRAEAASKERALVEFTETVKLRDVFLKGQYLVVHDEDRMYEGEACLSIYSGTTETPDQLVVSYHCQRVNRVRSDQFKVRISRARWYEIPEVTEIQFAGSSDAHRVPF
jgi:hypothetical protein